MLRAGIGWKPDILSSAAVNNIKNSELGCALLQTEPIVIEDAQHETRYESSPLLATNGVLSSMAVVIPGVGRPFGVLGAHSKTPRVFRRHEIEFLQSVAQFFAAVIERRRSEQALQASETRHREFVEHTPYGVYRATMFGRFVDVNPALVRMLGYSSAEELVAKPLSAVYGKVEDTDLLISQYAEAGVVSGVEIPWKRKDASTIIVRLAGRAVPDSTGNPLNLEIIVQDVTERRELEKQLGQAQKFEAIGQLAGGIAHDFNNVLGAVIGWAELGLEQASDRPRLREYFKKIGDQASRAAGLTRQLLAFARRQVLAPQNIQINGVVTGIFGLLESILGKNIQLETKLCDQPANVRADPTQLEQVLMNLCLNARDAMPQGGLLSIETKISQAPDELQIPGLASRNLRATHRYRHRHGHGCRHARTYFRTLFHHQGTRKRYRARTRNGVWNRQPTRRIYQSNFGTRAWLDFRYRAALCDAGTSPSESSRTSTRNHTRRERDPASR